MDLLDVELKGVMREEFSTALLKAFPKQQDLARLVQSAFDWELEHFTEGTPENRVEMLIDKVESEGKVRRLIRHAAWENPGNQKLQLFLKKWRLDLSFPVPLLKQLYGILHSAVLPMPLPMHVLDEVGGAVAEGGLLPQDWALSDELRTIELLEHLANRSPVGGRSHPLLEFVARLGHRQEAEAIRSQLQGWLSKAGQYLRLSQGQVESLWKNVEADVPGEPLYLLVKIDLQEPDEYMVKAWLSDERGEDCDVVFGGDGKRHPLSGLDAQVQELLGQVRKRHHKRLLAARNELTLEFFLPRKLLCRRLDSIPIEAGAPERVPLGSKYAVVVRSAERVDAGPESQEWFSWVARWKVFRANPASSQRILIRTDEESRRKEFIARMAEEKDFFLGLMLVPPANPHPQDKDPLTSLIIRTGMPIALWPQEGAPMGAEFEGLFERVLELPKQVRAKRHEGFSQGEHHLGNRLTLLWDDPERIPLDLREPQYFEAPDAQG
jgi:hypothetical protein